MSINILAILRTKRHLSTPLLLAIIIILFFFISLFYFRVIKFPYLDHGDSWEDAATLIPGNNFVKFGFINCRLLPIRHPQIEDPLDNPKSTFYTHSPPFHEIFHGLLRKILRTDSIRIFKFISLIAASLVLLLWFFLLRKLFDNVFALLGLFFFTTNPLFISFSDSISRYLFMELYRLLAITCFINFLKNKQKTNFVFLCIVLFIQAAMNYEYVIFLYIFMFGYSYLFRKSLKKKEWLVLLCVPFFAILLHFLQNAWALGGFRIAYSDLLSTLFRRALGKGGSEIGFSMLTIGSWFKLCFLRNMKIVNMFNFTWLAIPVIISLLLFHAHRLPKEFHNKLLKILSFWMLFFICGFSWWIIFVQHSFIHGYQTSLHMLLASVLLSASMFYLLIYFAKESYLGKNKIIFMTIVIGTLIFFSMQNILKSDLPITKFNRASKLLFINYSKILSELGANMSKDEYIYTNYWNKQVMAYYSDRNTHYITTLEQLKKSKHKKRYFLFFGGSKELFNYLKSNYRSIGSYVAQNIPLGNMMQFIIFEKNTTDS